MTRTIHHFRRVNGEELSIELVIDVEAVARAIAESHARTGKQSQRIIKRLDGAIVANVL